MAKQHVACRAHDAWRIHGQGGQMAYSERLGGACSHCWPDYIGAVKGNMIGPNFKSTGNPVGPG